MFLLRVVSLTLCLFALSSCATYPWTIEQPQVKVTHVQLLPATGLEQRIAVRLAILNPNSRDLSLRGISYTIGIENFDVLSGATSQLPILAADRKSTRLNSSHVAISYAVFCLKKKNTKS